MITQYIKYNKFLSFLEVYSLINDSSLLKHATNKVKFNLFINNKLK